MLWPPVIVDVSGFCKGGKAFAASLATYQVKGVLHIHTWYTAWQVFDFLFVSPYHTRRQTSHCSSRHIGGFCPAITDCAVAMSVKCEKNSSNILKYIYYAVPALRLYYVPGIIVDAPWLEN